MKVIVIGNGGREDSIRWKLKSEGVSIFHDIETTLLNFDKISSFIYR